MGFRVSTIEEVIPMRIVYGDIRGISDVHNPITGVLPATSFSLTSLPTTPISTDSAQRSFEDMIDIGVDIIYLEPVTAVAFPAAAVVRTLAQHMVDITEAENASLRTRIETNKAFEKITRNHERLARIWIEHQLAAVQESHRQD
uniref:Uncharacterized protein n=1 Tax=Tanacetum cinerariifolium TaxID=118510 RepID=A0A6L2NRH3_TANCI|nr:hypothetical protein [Tanacetum cinerariifolium]